VVVENPHKVMNICIMFLKVEDNSSMMTGIHKINVKILTLKIKDF